MCNTKLSKKAGFGANSFNDTQLSIVDVGIDASSYSRMQFVASAPVNINKDSRAGYGFHNNGRNAGTLYLDTDNYLKFRPNTGNVAYIINWKADV